MITVNESDTNLPAILKESKLANLITKDIYYAYGLKKENNPHILIEYERCYVTNTFEKRVTSLVEFFKLNGMNVEVISDSSKTGVDIGLRIDLRTVMNKNNKPLFAASVLSTIVYCLEDRIDIETMKTHKLSHVPKFED